MPLTKVTTEITTEVIDIIVNAVNLQHVDKGSLGPDTPLMKGGLELDSVDILEVIVAMEHRYGVKVTDPETGKKYFQTIGTIVEFIQTKGTTA